MNPAGHIPSPKALRRGIAVAALVGALAAAAAAPVWSSQLARATGDEPHYLLTAISIAEDRSLDISDEQAARRYLPFHETSLTPQGEPADDGRLVSPHDPLLPVLLAVPVTLGGWLGARLTLALMAGALAALLLWVGVRRFDVPLGPALLVICVFAASAPMAIYGSQVYPEMPAALALAVAIACLTGPLQTRGLALLALSMVLLCWLGTKFVLLAAVLAAICIVRLIRTVRYRDALVFSSALAMAAVAYVVAHYAWYGGLTPYAAGAHFANSGEFSVIGRSPNLLGRSQRLIGLLVDRNFGLAAWQPAWLLMIPALAVVLRRRPPGWHVLVLPLLVGWLTATFLALTMHGWWWPGRQVVVVLPAAVLLIAQWSGTISRAIWVTAALGSIGLTSYVWTVVEGWRKQITLAVDFAETANPAYRIWRTLLPDYAALSAPTWIRHVCWIALVCFLAAAAAGWDPGHLRRASPLPATTSR